MRNRSPSPIASAPRAQAEGCAPRHIGDDQRGVPHGDLLHDGGRLKSVADLRSVPGAHSPSYRVSQRDAMRKLEDRGGGVYPVGDAHTEDVARTGERHAATEL